MYAHTTCTNTLGGFSCDCIDGYDKDSNNVCTPSLGKFFYFGARHCQGVAA